VRKAISIAAVYLGVVALAAPAAIGAPGKAKGPKGAGAQAKVCAKLKKADRAAFRATYGPKRAMRNCVRGDAPRAARVQPRELKNAAQECRAERAQDPGAFREAYGTNVNKRNAFGKCVVSKLRERRNGGGDNGAGEGGGEESGSQA
jgi:hypothetical protein